MLADNLTTALRCRSSVQTHISRNFCYVTVQLKHKNFTHQNRITNMTERSSAYTGNTYQPHFDCSPKQRFVQFLKELQFFPFKLASFFIFVGCPCAESHKRESLTNLNMRLLCFGSFFCSWVCSMLKQRFLSKSRVFKAV